MTTSDIATRNTEVVLPDQAPAEVPDTLAKLQEWGQTFQAVATASEGLAQSPFVPVAFKGKPADCTAAIMAGMELGLSPMASLKAFDVIQGQAAPRAITIAAVAQAAGHELRIVEWDDDHCVMEGRRKGETKWQQVEWTTKRADDLGLLGKDQWKKQKRTMLRWRCTSELGRIIAADALLGIPYSAEEIRDMDPVEATVISSTTSPHGKSLRELAEERKPKAAPAPVPATDEQLTLMGGALESHGIQPEERPAYIARIIGRAVQHKRDLTAEEADKVIDSLEVAI